MVGWQVKPWWLDASKQHLERKATMQQAQTTSGFQVLCNGLETITNSDKFREAMERTLEAAFMTVFQAQDEGKLKWRRVGDGLRDMVTEAVVKDGRGENVTVLVTLYTTADDEGFKNTYLALGNRPDAPSHSTGDPRVKRLYEQLTGEPWTPR
jgi:hypothetical protein